MNIRRMHRWARSHRHNGDSRSPLPSLALPESSSEAFTSQPPTIIQHNSEKPKKAPSKTESQEGINNLLPSTPTKGSKKGQKTTVKNISTIFSSPNCTTIMAQTGTTAILHCEVNDIAENTVTWIRKKNHSLLTVGLVTYSADPRFFAAHGRHPRDWALHIRFAAPGDAGMYECQVPTHPPTSLYVKLVIVEANADIIGGPDKIVQQGSMLRLSCQVRKSTEPPTYLFWYHENRMINYDLDGVVVTHSRQSSELVIQHAEPRHAGNYTCAPANAKPDSVTVHILHSETPAAMQHGNQSATSRANPKPKLIVCLLLYLSCVTNTLLSAFVKGVHLIA
ncbi:zwei Ig domain protein zig-8-like [Arctopsyche grandis]|uniref:zwei Ig domain protein zig-8-like n=1 Tax=Arctopsyche grandis TaxID=121162 RepID=UPI00406D8575